MYQAPHRGQDTDVLILVNKKKNEAIEQTKESARKTFDTSMAEGLKYSMPQLIHSWRMSLIAWAACSWVLLDMLDVFSEDRVSQVNIIHRHAVSVFSNVRRVVASPLESTLKWFLHLSLSSAVIMLNIKRIVHPRWKFCHHLLTPNVVLNLQYMSSLFREHKRRVVLVPCTYNDTDAYQL